MVITGETVRIELTLEEAMELFTRCLNSQEDDTLWSASAIRKLGAAIASYNCEQPFAA